MGEFMFQLCTCLPSFARSSCHDDSPVAVELVEWPPTFSSCGVDPCCDRSSLQDPYNSSNNKS